jgi:hypothetical protein
MPFDFGGGATGMGQLTINVAEALHGQLAALYPGRTVGGRLATVSPLFRRRLGAAEG